jgi:hypothetical protein
MKRVTESKIRQKAKEATDSLDYLINPSDVDSEASEWSDIDEMQIDDEIAECFAHMPDRRNDSRYSELVYNLAFQYMRDALTRAPMADLAFDSKREALANGYWPNSMNRMEMEDMAYNDIQCHTFKEDNEALAHIWQECEQEALQVVDSGIADGLKPDVFKQD